MIVAASVTSSVITAIVLALQARTVRAIPAGVLRAAFAYLALAIVVDINDLTRIISGSTDDAAGWYASRACILIATVAVLGMVLQRAVRVYTALAERAAVLEDEAHTDTLTGLPNRRRFDEQFARVFGSTKRRNGALALAIVDIDRFKLYNDAFGHQSGDEALHAIGQAIADSVRRSGDFAARYGGEEFVVILDDTTLEGAVEVAEQIRAAVPATGLRTSSGSPLTVSVGVAVRNPGESAEDVLHHADEALYRAKDAGRNRVLAWTGPTSGER
jgi:diguanylate cyclase (GGDEF)-like protein